MFFLFTGVNLASGRFEAFVHDIQSIVFHPEKVEAAIGGPITIDAPLTVSGSNILSASKFADNANGGFFLAPAASTSLTVNGSVGIGTSSPLSKLQISLPSVSSFMRLREDGQGVTMLIGAGLTPTRAYISSTNYPLAITASSDIGQLLLATDGKIGIGTTAPAYKLDVRTSEAGLVQIAFANNYTDAGVKGAGITAIESGTQNFAQIGVLNAASTSLNGVLNPSTGFVRSGTDATGGLSLFTQASAPIRFATGGFADANTHMRLGSTGLLTLGSSLLDGTAQFNIIGKTDIVQEIVKAHSSQTANLTEWQNSSGTVIGGRNSSGYIGVGTNTNANYPINIDLSLAPTAAVRSIYNKVLSSTNQVLNGFFNWVETTAATGTTTNLSGNVYFAINSGAGNVTASYGSFGFTRNSGAGTITDAYGASMTVDSQSGGEITNAHGLRAQILKGNTGNIITASSVEAIIQNSNATGSIGTAKGLDLSRWSNSGTITTSYGIYADTSIDVGATKYFIYSSSLASSVLAGSLGVGTTAPSQTFQVNNNGSSAFVVTSAGKVGIGTTNPTSALTFGASSVIALGTADTADNQYLALSGGGTFSSDRGASMILYGNEVASTGGNLELYAGKTTGDIILWTNGGNALVIDQAGVMTAPLTYANTIGATYRDLQIDNSGEIGYVSSSLRYKKDVTTLTNADWLYDLRPVQYRYKDDPNQQLRVGLIAEEVDKVNPLFVSYDATGRPETVTYGDLVTPLLLGLQQQKKDIKKLEAKTNQIQSLEQKIEAQQKTIDTLTKQINLMQMK